ncbi:MAG: GNAT family N-acetyltransferase, partial [Tepidisphaeraceae bacterium]
VSMEGNLTTVRAALKSDSPFLASVRKAADPGHELSEPTYFDALLETPETLVLVAQSQGAIIGYSALKMTAHSAVAAQRPLQLWQIYVMPGFHGAGVAAQLMSAVLAHARGREHDVIWLGVSEHNARGMAFYRKHDFEVVGQFMVGSAEHAHRDVVMSRRVRIET